MSVSTADGPGRSLWVVPLLVVLGVGVFFLWRAGREEDALPGEAEVGDPATGDEPASLEVLEALTFLATEDDIPGLSSRIPAAECPRDQFFVMVGRDPRMFDRGSSPERVTQLRELTQQLEEQAHQPANDDLDSRRNAAFIKYVLALITAEIEQGESAGDWGLQAAEELEALHQDDPEHWPTRLLLARLHRLLGKVDTEHDRDDMALAHQLFASDRIRAAVEQSPDDATLQLEWGLQLTYLAEAQLRFEKPQMALQSFLGAIDCFEECVALAPDPVNEPLARFFWESEDASRRYFEAYNAYSLAMLLTRANRQLEAREYWSQSLDTFDALSTEYPESLKFRQRYAQGVSNEGSRLAAANDTAGALLPFEQAAELYAALVADAPYDATNQHGLAMALGNQAMMLAKADRFDEALAQALYSLDTWETYIGMRPDGNFGFRDPVVWKAAELLAQQATVKLADDPAAALALAQQEVELVTTHWDHNELLQQMVSLHGLELALAEEVYQYVVMQREANSDPAEWITILDQIVARLMERRPEDDAPINLRERMAQLRGE